ncbi:type IX secretion system membrane protein PorP/SprF [Pontibacter sp. KCTC 32443]|uniref:PorP/SprF family type IX secretion system membrane protein n=1 Tax=Pontibacter TaxID=323449 RepID=UPI00164ECA49|nr:MULTISPECIES: type IX secretion system membrane protein PorP/SprF [Pontibacter]MBC5775807.1 type IX secretion system membrane protein PorP/SprF [Pontibacter sp. KCTC 32443]
MKKLLPVFLLFLLYSQKLMAQQQPQFTHYSFNGMQLSPAYAGITNRPEVLSIFRYQWLGYDASFDDGGSPQTLLLTAHTPVRLLNGGVGITLMRDKIANTTQSGVALSYSFHIPIGEAKLGLGVQGNYNKIKKGEYRPNQPDDPFVPLNSSDTKYDLGAGIWYESSTFYAGGGVTNLLKAEYEFSNIQDNVEDDVKGTFFSENHIYATAGYHLPVANMFILTPMALVKHDTETFSFDAGAKVTYEEKYWAGVNYRHKEAVGALIGLGLFTDNSLRVGYAFDFTIFDRVAKAPTSHEVMLSYRLPEPAVRFKPPVRTPRYNFTK